MKRELYSYQRGLDLMDWDGQQPLVVFDGVCVLCSFFAQWILRNDKQCSFRFATAQSPLGQALFKHYQLNPTEFETNLVIIDGQLYEKLYGFFAVCRVLGYPWRLLAVFRLLPRFLLDWVYERIARNRYALFGRRSQCLVPDEALAKRMVGS